MLTFPLSPHPLRHWMRRQPHVQETSWSGECGCPKRARSADPFDLPQCFNL